MTTSVAVGNRSVQHDAPDYHLTDLYGIEVEVSPGSRLIIVGPDGKERVISTIHRPMQVVGILVLGESLEEIP